LRLFDLDNGFVNSFYRHQVFGVKVVRCGIGRIQRQSALNPFFGLCPLPVMQPGMCERGMRLGKCFVYFESFRRRSFRSAKTFS
jgi:hypothetical protein